VQNHVDVVWRQSERASVRGPSLGVVRRSCHRDGALIAKRGSSIGSLARAGHRQ
jgi:hypothetical protein